MANEKPCELCGRENLTLTFHHLIPRTLHSTKWYKKNFSMEQLQSGADLCHDCHDAVHRFIPEKVLGKDYNTVEKLMAHEKVSGFVTWVSKRKGSHKTDQPVWHRRG